MSRSSPSSAARTRGERRDPRGSSRAGASPTVSSVPFAEVEHGRLEFDDEGDPGALPLLLLHAGNATRRMWDSIVPTLLPDHRVLRYDARGFGGSPPAASQYLGSDDAVSLLDACGIDRAVLIGSSFGGRVALDTALAAPDRVVGVVMIGAVPGGAVPDYTEREQALAGAADDAETAQDWTRRADLDVDIWNVGPTRHRNDLDPAYLERSIRCARAQVDLLRDHPGTMCAVGQPAAIGRLSEVRAPLLSLVGEHDLAFTRAQHERTVATVGDPATGAVIPDAAHFPSLEQPAATLAVLGPWLRDRRP